MMTLETMQSFNQMFTLLQQQQNEEDNFPQTYFSPSSSTATAVNLSADTYLLETFHQYPHGDFRPTFYNPFEIKHRRRTSRAQLKILEKSFSENAKPSATIRRILAQRLDMTPRGVQIWFQNRRAKAKLLKRKPSIQQQQLRQSTNQNSSGSDKNEEEEEKEECSSSDSKSLEKQELSFNDFDNQETIANNNNISQSSILFSQFFANVQNIDMNKNPQASATSSFLSTGAHVYMNNFSNPHVNWQQQQRNNSVIDNARTVATAAAAAAVATTSNLSAHQFEPSMVSSIGESSSDWPNLNDTSNGFHHQQQLQSLRRQSCPMPDIDKPKFLSDIHFHGHQQQESAYFSPSSWPQSITSQSNQRVESRNSSPMPLFSNFKRHFSFDANSTSPITAIDNYPLQDIHLTPSYVPQHQQLTPPLTASCSSSTVAGSPITLDTLYNDPIAVPPHHYAGYYSNHHSRISSPLSTTALVTDTMLSFV